MIRTFIATDMSADADITIHTKCLPPAAILHTES